MINPDFAQVAEACGIRGYSVINPDKLKNTLQEALLHNGPALVDVFTNPHVLTLPPHTSVGVMFHYIDGSNRNVNKWSLLIAVKTRKTTYKLSESSFSNLTFISEVMHF